MMRIKLSRAVEGKKKGVIMTDMIKPLTGSVCTDDGCCSPKGCLLKLMTFLKTICIGNSMICSDIWHKNRE